MVKPHVLDFFAMGDAEKRAIVKAAPEEVRQWFAVATELAARRADGRLSPGGYVDQIGEHIDRIYARNLVAGMALRGSELLLQTMLLDGGLPRLAEAALAWIDLYERFRWPEER